MVVITVVGFNMCFVMNTGFWAKLLNFPSSELLVLSILRVPEDRVTLMTQGGIRYYIMMVIQQY